MVLFDTFNVMKKQHEHSVQFLCFAEESKQCVILEQHDFEFGPNDDG